jgi:hypothetical protein
MPDWLLAVVRPLWEVPRAGWRRLQSMAAERQDRASAGADVVSDVQEFLGRATPLAVSIEGEPGEIRSRLDDFNYEWEELRPRLRKYTNGHPSDQIRKLGPELIDEVEKLLLGLRYMSSKFTDLKEKAAVSESVFAQHARSVKLADDLLGQIHR